MALNNNLLRMLLPYGRGLTTLIRSKEGVKNDRVTPLMIRSQRLFQCGNELVLCGPGTMGGLCIFSLV